MAVKSLCGSEIVAGKYILVCESMLFKITFEIPIWGFCTRKIIRNIEYFEKTTFKIPLFVIKDPCEQTAAFHVKMVYVFPA